MTIRRAALAGRLHLAGWLACPSPLADCGRCAVAREAAKTTITFPGPGCDGCQVQLMQARWKTGPGHGIRFWHTAERTVDGDSLSFTVPTRHTHGMSMTVVAPWEGNTGYDHDRVPGTAGRTRATTSPSARPGRSTWPRPAGRGRAPTR